MKTKSLRVPSDLMSAIERVEKTEKIEEATAMRKLLRIGFETYVGNLYRQGKMTLREAAKVLNISLPEAFDVFWDAGIRGNLDSSDVINSLKRFAI